MTIPVVPYHRRDGRRDCRDRAHRQDVRAGAQAWQSAVARVSREAARDARVEAQDVQSAVARVSQAEARVSRVEARASQVAEWDALAGVWASAVAAARDAPAAWERPAARCSP